MKNKNIFKLFFVLMLFIMACKAYVEEKKEIESLMEGISKLKNDSSGDTFKDYKDKINKLKESLKDVSNSELEEKLLKLQSLFQDKLAAKLAALKAAKQTIEGYTDKDQKKTDIWKEAKLVGVTVPLLGSNATGNGEKMSTNAVGQIDKVIKFLEEDTN
ncbi:fibronectin-binding protein RevA [Borreliella burgdorferi]|uniref:fibronectin-binding protein RevA n=1 Tax=Borreliella burgdorferi TaxID=139 RepID=UPI001E4608B8|nr:fibronectin-binding protein RevA [Borreliella burgdorferi]MCD2375756.1 fibronectin-binding protein RevA [Borreliella burgdorferi]MCD2410039.1 fibronectin-binding protein RevA [Borreliella burgdorferi]MCD2416113.1 fibronectin-binding protein RevA [Borreliella burgdorferi]MCD2417233.1 fibronectin-binding protein RevA [Borreliella burgdorferi]MCD2419460.1 fibronectin-binding protein RevA [Borreliella burgdorferi]